MLRYQRCRYPDTRIHVAIDTALGLMQEIGIQAYQVGAGHRKGGIDWGQVLVTGVSSAAGGAAAGPLGDKLGNALGKKLGDSLGAKVAGGAITGTTAGLAGAGAGYVAATGTQLALDTYHHGWDQAWGNAKSAGIDPHMIVSRRRPSAGRPSSSSSCVMPGSGSTVRSG